MMNHSIWKIGFICLAIALISLGCGKKEPEKLSGSCFAPWMSDQSKVCLEYSTHELVKEFKNLCEPAMKGTWSDGTCNTEGSLGGCETGDNKIWFYPAGKYQTREDVKNFCAKKDRVYLEP